jgi:hypothetical protein
MSQWRCKLSGTVITVPDYEDHNMEGHDGYEKVVETKPEPEPKKPAKAPKE